ncbi:MAG: alpha/beta fold hydrolase, partial [Candidatus Zixiibacteriota bacterium]
MPYADLGDMRMYYEAYGSGPPVVMLHGFTLDRRMWYPNIGALQREYRVLLPDARGHGLSDAPETGYSRDHRVEDLRRLVTALQLDTFHLVGLSMGGSTAIGYALKYQLQLRSLTLVSTGAAGYSLSKKLSRLDEVAKDDGIEAAKARWIEWSLAYYRHRHHEIGEKLRTMMTE